MKLFSTWTRVAMVALAGVAVDAGAAFARVDAGMLTCEVGKGFALIVSSPRDLH
jgi:hypothetical protein